MTSEQENSAARENFTELDEALFRLDFARKEVHRQVIIRDYLSDAVHAAARDFGRASAELHRRQIRLYTTLGLRGLCSKVRVRSAGGRFRYWWVRGVEVNLTPTGFKLTAYGRRVGTGGDDEALPGYVLAEGFVLLDNGEWKPLNLMTRRQLVTV